MCWFKKKEEKPDWVTQTRKQVAEEEEMAAGIHYSILTKYEEDPEFERQYSQLYGDRDWQWKWYLKHSRLPGISDIRRRYELAGPVCYRIYNSHFGIRI